MTLLNLGHAHKARRIDNASHEIALGDTVAVNHNDSMKMHAVWPAHSQYGLSAFVISDTGHVDVVSLDGYGTDKVSQSLFNGAVRHAGQASHGFPKHTEQTIESRFTHRIKMIVPVIHTKYFGKHGCALDHNIKFKITNDAGLDISMSPREKPSSNQIYNFSPCIIRNGPDGIMVHSWEKYSEPSTYFAPLYDINRHELLLETKEI